MRHAYFDMYPYPKEADIMPTFPTRHDDMVDPKLFRHSTIGKSFHHSNMSRSNPLNISNDQNDIYADVNASPWEVVAKTIHSSSTSKTNRISISTDRKRDSDHYKKRKHS
jgi:hypothetical protein